MNKLLNRGKQHVLALVFFGGYLLCWLKLATISAPIGPHGQADACARGMLMVPLLAGLICSSVYCFTLLVFAVFSQGRQAFFWVLFGLAVLFPFLLLHVM